MISLTNEYVKKEKTNFSNVVQILPPDGAAPPETTADKTRSLNLSLHN